MPASTLNIAGIVTALNEVNVKHKVFEQIEQGTLGLDVIEHGDQNTPQAVALLDKVEGRYVQLHAHVDGNPNVAVPVGETGGYPIPGSQGYDVIRYRTQRSISSLAQTSKALTASQTDEQAVFRVAARETPELVRNTRKKQNKDLYGDGSGLLATVASSSGWNDSTKTVTVDDVSKLSVGMEVHFRGKQDAALPANWTTASDQNGTVPYPGSVVSINTATNTAVIRYYNTTAIDLSADTTQLNSLGMYFGSVQGETQWGLENLVSITNPSAHGFNPAGTMPTDDAGMSKAFGAIDRNTAGNDWWIPTAPQDLGGAAVSVKDHLDPLEVTLTERDSTLMGDDAVMCLCRGAQFNSVVYNLEQAKRTFERTKITRNHYNVVRSGIFTFGRDGDVPSASMWFFVPKHMYRLILTPWAFETRAGGQWAQIFNAIQRPTGAWQANMEQEGNLITSSCAGAHKFTNVG